MGEFFNKLYRNLLKDNVNYDREFKLLKYYLRKYDVYRRQLNDPSQTWLVTRKDQTDAVGFDVTTTQNEAKILISKFRVMLALEKFYKNSVFVEE
jgi:hypothetical protein